MPSNTKHAKNAKNTGNSRDAVTNTASTVDNDINIYHVDVLDGIRGFAILIVVWFHLWQQCWIMPIVDTPALSFLNINTINLDPIPRTGYLMVVMMIFLSGFCLYLPYARHSIYGEKLPSTRLFYKKRVARIIPSYLFCIIVVLIYDIATSAYTSSSFMAKDIITHLTFTFNLFSDTHEFTKLNVVLWTVALEVQFYILFPVIRRCFEKKPILTYAVMCGISFAYVIIAQKHGNSNILLHQLPSYLGVYANGFVGAQIFVGLSKKIKRDKYIGLISLITSLGCMYVYFLLAKNLCAVQDINGWQLRNRFTLSILYMIFTLSTVYALSFYRKIFANRVMRFVSTISFNLYIWHQFLAVVLKVQRIPYYTGDTPPNQTGDTVWMWEYFILCIVVGLAMAILTTYLIEKPFSKLIMNLGKNKDADKDSGKSNGPDKNPGKNKAPGKSLERKSHASGK